jgi:hypothetical protein
VELCIAKKMNKVEYFGEDWRGCGNGSHVMVRVATGHPTVKRNGGAVEHCTEASDKAMESWSGDNDAMYPLRLRYIHIFRTTEVVPTEHPSMTKAFEEEEQRNSEQRDLDRNCAVSLTLRFKGQH